MKTPEQIAQEVVDQLSFSSNRMLNGRLVGEQYFAAKAIAEAIRTDRQNHERAARLIGCMHEIGRQIASVRRRIGLICGQYAPRIHPRHVRKLAAREAVVKPLREIEAYLVDEHDKVKASYAAHNAKAALG